MTPNLEDIARLAGVSRSTVSRVVNNHPNVRPATKEKVLTIIREQNFQPNQVARMLATQRTYIIGVFASQTASTFFTDTSSYFPTIIQGIADVANERNYATLLWLNDGGKSQNQDAFCYSIARNRLIDGLLLISGSSSQMLISNLVDTDLPFVSIERPRMLADRVTYVSIDNVEAARTAVRHLIQIGRCRIGVIMGPADNTDALDRLIGYRAALAEAGLPGSHQWEFVGSFSADTGLQGGRALLQQRVDAIFAGSDQIAVGLLQACREEGVRVPDDVAVIAFDDLPVAVQVTPALTTIHHPIREKGAVATQLLVEMIESHCRLPQAVHLPTHLVVRESCGAGRSQFAAEGGDVSH